MSRTLKSFAELADFFALEDLGEAPLVDGSDDPGHDTEPCDLETLHARLEEAGAALEEATRVDATAREEARRLLDAYEAEQGRRDAAAQALERARQLVGRADDLRAHALDFAARAAAEHARDLATGVHLDAARAVADLDREIEARRASPDLARILETHRQERAAADERERSRRLDELADAIQRALDAGHLAEARRLLDDLVREAPGSALVQALEETFRARRRTQRLGETERALGQACRMYRRQPKAAVALLESLDLDGLPTELRRQLVGVWKSPCLRLCADRAASDVRLRYLPEPCYGVLMARERPDAPYAVVSALGGGGRYATGSPVPDAVVRAARPLDLGHANRPSSPEGDRRGR